MKGNELSDPNRSLSVACGGGVFFPRGVPTTLLSAFRVCDEDLFNELLPSIRVSMKRTDSLGLVCLPGLFGLTEAYLCFLCAVTNGSLNLLWTLFIGLKRRIMGLLH